MPLRAKSDAADAVQPMFKAELGYPISVMSDEGGEFKGDFVRTYMKVWWSRF
jgi:hypothetical protein